MFAFLKRFQKVYPRIEGNLIHAKLDDENCCECPGCAGTDFKKGAEGGMSTNLFCVGCSAKWNALSINFEPINGVSRKIYEDLKQKEGI